MSGLKIKCSCAGRRRRRRRKGRGGRREKRKRRREGTRRWERETGKRKGREIRRTDGVLRALSQEMKEVIKYIYHMHESPILSALIKYIEGSWDVDRGRIRYRPYRCRR